MTIPEAKDQAAREAGYENFAEYQCDFFTTSTVLDRAMEIYAKAQYNQGISNTPEKVVPEWERLAYYELMKK